MWEEILLFVAWGLLCIEGTIVAVRRYRRRRKPHVHWEPGTGTPSLPNAPSDLTATASGENTINLTWTDNSTDESNFVLERRTGTAAFTQINTPAAGATTYSDTGLSAGTAYEYRIKAVNVYGSSGYSATASATTDSLASTPIAPSALTATATGTTTIDLGWTDNSDDEVGFKVERRIGTNSWSQIALAAANAVAYNDTGLTQGTTYEYRVRAYNAVGDSAYTAVANATTTTAVVPTAPSSLTATVNTASSIDLAWTDNATNETGYRVYRSTDNTSYTLVGTLATNAAAYTATSLAGSTTYYFKVVAYNAVGESSAVYANAKTLPRAPTGLVATATGQTTMDLSWTDNSTDETAFSVEWKILGGSYAVLVNTAANVTSYTHTNLTASTTYYYRVRALAAQGNSAYCTETYGVTFPEEGGATVTLKGVTYALNAHPRIVFTAAKKVECPDKALANNAPWVVVNSYYNVAGIRGGATYPATHADSRDIESYLGMYWATGTTTYRDYAITELLSFTNPALYDVSNDGSTYAGNDNCDYGSIDLQIISQVYSALHDEMTPTQRTTLRDWVHNALLPLTQWHPYDYHKPTANPRHNLTMTKLVGELMWGLATCDEDVRGAATLQEAYNYYVDSLLPIYDAAFIGGHIYGGAQYGYGRWYPYLARLMTALENSLVGFTGFRDWAPSVLDFMMHHVIPGDDYLYSDYQNGWVKNLNGRPIVFWTLFLDKYKTLAAAQHFQHWLKNVFVLSDSWDDRGVIASDYAGGIFIVYNPANPTTLSPVGVYGLSYAATGSDLFFSRSAWLSNTACHVSLDAGPFWGDHQTYAAGDFRITRNNEWIVVDNSPSFGAGNGDTLGTSGRDSNAIQIGGETTTCNLTSSSTNSLNNHSYSTSYAYAMAKLDGAYTSTTGVSYCRRRLCHLLPYNGSPDYFVFLDTIGTTTARAKRSRAYVPYAPTVANSDATVLLPYSGGKAIVRAVIGDTIAATAYAAPVDGYGSYVDQAVRGVNVHQVYITNTNAATADTFCHVWCCGGSGISMCNTTALSSSDPSGALRGVLLDDSKMSRVYLGSNTNTTVAAVNIAVEVPYTSNNGCEVVISDLTPGTKYTPSYSGGSFLLNVNASATTLVDANGVFTFIDGTAAPGGWPNAPSNIVATVNTNVSVDVAWDDNSDDEDNFVLERSDNNASFAVINSPAANAVTYLDTGLTPSTYYIYRIKSENTNGASSYVTANAVTTYGPPAAPTNCSAVAVNTTAINVSWTDAASNEDNFELERKTTGAYSQINTPAANVVYYVDTGLSEATTYYYKIRTNNAYGTSDYSNEASCSTSSASDWANFTGITFGGGEFGASTYDSTMHMGTSDAVFEAVFKTTTAANNMTILSSSVSDADYRGYAVFLNTASGVAKVGLHLATHTGGPLRMWCTWDYYSTVNFKDGNIHKLRIVVDRDQTNPTCYVDGQTGVTPSYTEYANGQTALSNLSALSIQNYRTRIGAFAPGSNVFYGTIYEVRMSIATTTANSGGPNETTAPYDYGTSTDPTQLHYKMDEASGDITDECNALTLTASGTLTYSVPG